MKSAFTSRPAIFAEQNQNARLVWLKREESAPNNHHRHSDDDAAESERRRTVPNSAREDEWNANTDRQIKGQHRPAAHRLEHTFLTHRSIWRDIHNSKNSISRQLQSDITMISKGCQLI